MAAGTGFPYVLYDLLKKESSSIVMWTSTGTAFGIRDMAAFRQEVLTCYFKHNKFSSFQRQLNLYGFRKVVKGRESGCYMHPSFLRDCPEKLTEVKRGVVPPCPAHYSRKIYGSGPRFMSQDDGSDSEPELVVQPRGHWDKTLAHSDVATHMKLGEMHVTAAALAATRAQVKGDASSMNSGHAAAAAIAAAHHLQEAQAQLQLHGIPGNGRSHPPSPPPQGMQLGRHLPPQSQGMDIDVGGRLAPQQQHGMASRMGAGGGRGMYGGDIRGTGGAGGEGARGRPRSGLSKMFGSNRPPMGAKSGSGGSSGGMPPPPTSSSFMGGRSGSVPSSQSQQRQHLGHQQLQQQQLHQQQLQQQQLHQQQQQLHQQQQQQMEQQRYRASAVMAEEQEGGSSGRGPMGSGHIFSPRLTPSDGGGQDGGVGMSIGVPGGGGGAGGVSDSKTPIPGAPGRLGQTSTVASLSKMLEGLEQTLDCPLEEEMYTPIDKRNSFCAQMVNIAQVLEDDPAMHARQGIEAKSFHGNNNPLASHLVQKRRSSMSELAAYLSDMLEDGESSRSVATTPGWMLPPPIPQNQAEYPSSRDGSGGAGNRGPYKRTFDGDYGSYGAFGMDTTDTSSPTTVAQTDGCSSGTPAAAPGWDGAINRDGGAGGNHASDSPRSNPKRARANPISPVSASFPSMESNEGKVGGESGQGREGAAVPGAKVAASPNLVQALACLASALPGHSDSEESKDGAEGSGVRKKGKGGHSAAAAAATADFGDRGGSAASVVIKEESVVARESSEEALAEAEKQGDRGGETGQPPVGRVGNNAINDVLTNFSIDQAIEQLKSDDGKDDDEAGHRSVDNQEKGLRHRASVYVLMHAIATVNTANEGEQWGQQDAQEELLDCPESSVAAAI